MDKINWILYKEIFEKECLMVLNEFLLFYLGFIELF